MEDALIQMLDLLKYYINISRENKDRKAQTSGSLLLRMLASDRASSASDSSSNCEKRGQGKIESMSGREFEKCTGQQTTEKSLAR